MNTKKTLSLILAITIIAVTLSACGGSGGPPDGRYEPVDEAIALTIPFITIKGNNFTQGMPMGITSTTMKFKYKDGTITFTDGVAGLNVACEYRDGSLWYSGAEFEKVK